MAIVVLLVANVVQAGKIFDLFWPDASRASYFLQGAISAAYIVIAIIQGDVLIALAAMAVLSYLVFGHVVFVLNTGLRANFNAIVMYFPLLTFIALAKSNCSMRSILRIFVRICFAYSLFYILVNAFILKDLGQSAVVLDGHDEGTGRVYLAAAYPAFVALYALRARRLHAAIRIVMIAVALSAMIMSGTRAFIGAFLLVFAIGVARHMSAGVRLALMVVVLTGMTVILLGLVWTGWNPFSWFASDSSGLYRAFEYQYAIKVLQSHWFFGVGTPTNFTDLQAFLQTPKYSPLYSSDLGIIAPLFEFGLPGLVIFIAATCFCMMAPVESKGPEFQALKLTCITCASYAIISPLLLLEPAAIFVMLLVALQYRENRSVMGRAPKGEWFFHIADD